MVKEVSSSAGDRIPMTDTLVLVKLCLTVWYYPPLSLQNTYHTQFAALLISSMTLNGIGYFQNTAVTTIHLYNVLHLIELEL